MRERILNIAFKHFSKFGYSKTTLTGIAKELGIQKTALYYYFKNKEAIFQAIVLQEAENFYFNLVKTFDAQTSPEKQLSSYVHERIRSMHFIAQRYQTLKAELFALLPIIEMTRTPFVHQEIILLATCISTGNAQGVFDVKAPEHMATSIVYALKGMEIPMYVSDQVSYSTAEVNELIHLYLNGLKSRT